MSLLTLLLPGVALAVQPDASLSQAALPARPRRAHVHRQEVLRHGEAWQGFLFGEGAGWVARFDERTDLPRRAWGPGIPLGLASDAGEDAVVGAVEGFLSRHEGLLGLPADRFVLDRAVRVPGTDHWILRFDQVTTGGTMAQGPDDLGLVGELTRQGRPIVFQSGITVHVGKGRVVSLGVEADPDSDRVDTEPTVSAATAIQVAIDDGPVPGAEHEVEGAALVVLPGKRAGRLAWAVNTRTTPDRGDPPGIWVSYVDAHTGELLGADNLVRFLSGTVWGTHDTRTVDGDYSTSALQYLTVKSADDSEVTDEDGAFELSGDALEIDALSGTYFRVRNRSGSDGSVTWSDGDLTLTDADATQAEIDSYVFLSQIGRASV